MQKSYGPCNEVEEKDDAGNLSDEARLKNAAQECKKSDEEKQANIDFDQDQRRAQSAEEEEAGGSLLKRGTASQCEHHQCEMLWMVRFAGHETDDEHHDKAGGRHDQHATRDSVEEPGRRRTSDDPE